MSQYLKVKSFKKKSYRMKIRPHGPLVLGPLKRSETTGLILRTNRAVLLNPDGTNSPVEMVKLLDAPFKQNVRKQILTKGCIVQVAGREETYEIISRCTVRSILLRRVGT